MGESANFAPKLIDALYTESMILADEARTYFEQDMRADKPEMSALQRVELSCESLKVTTRLMHSIAWLMNQKAYFAGELSETQLRNHGRMLGDANASDPLICGNFPPRAQDIIRSSEDLYMRICRLEQKMRDDFIPHDAAVHNAQPVVRHMQSELERLFG